MNQKKLATTSRFLAWKSQCKYRGRSRGNFSRTCDRITLDAAWYDSFLGGMKIARGGRSLPVEDAPKALNLMADWCVPTV